MEGLESLLGKAIAMLVLLAVTLLLLGLISWALRWIWELWGGRR
jgi:hypothetical protein